MGRIIQFLREVKTELSKVVWPTRREALRSTGIVIFYALFVAVFLGLIDLGLSRVVEFIVGK